MKTWLLALVLAAPRAAPPRATAATPAVVSAPALSGAEVKAQVEAYLGSIDTPISQERWRALGPQATPVLRGLALGHDALPSRRARAVEGWSALGGQDAATQLARLALSSDEPYLVRLSAVHGAERAAPESSVVSTLKPLLEGAPDPRIRGEAATLLVKHDPTLCSQVEEQVKRKPEHRERFARALKRCAP